MGATSSLRTRFLSVPLVCLSVWTGLSHAGEGSELSELDCVIEPNVVVDVSSAAEGALSVVHVDRSDTVQRGQILAVLDAGVEQATVELASARAIIDTEIRLGEASLGLDQRNMTRIQALYEKNAVALTLQDEARTAVTVSALKLLKARQDKHLAELEMQRVKAVLERRTVRSPVSGVVVQRFKSPGEYVENEAIVQVAELHPLRVEVVAPVEVYGVIRPGMQAEIVPELAPDSVKRATVTVVDRVMDAASGTFGVRLELPNPDFALPGGLRCQVRFLPAEPSEVLDDEPAAVELVTVEDALTPAAIVPSEDESASAQPIAIEYESAPTPEDQADEFQALVTEAPRQHVPVCRSLGPIARADEVEVLEAALTTPGVLIEHREETQSSIIGYLIIAPVPSGTSAAEFERTLIDSGITHYQLFRNGASKGSFSLGYYRGTESATIRLAQLSDLGVSANIKPQLKSALEYWVNLTFTDGALDETSLLRTAESALPGAQPRIAPCADLVAADVPRPPTSVVVH